MKKYIPVILTEEEETTGKERMPAGVGLSFPSVGHT
jgi:hypothetical protein